MGKPIWGKWANNWQCTTTGLDKSMELQMGHIHPAVSEICDPQSPEGWGVKCTASVFNTLFGIFACVPPYTAVWAYIVIDFDKCSTLHCYFSPDPLLIGTQDYLNQCWLFANAENTTILVRPQCVNSLWPSDAIWCHRLSHGMSCHLINAKPSSK